MGGTHGDDNRATAQGGPSGGDPRLRRGTELRCASALPAVGRSRQRWPLALVGVNLDASRRNFRGADMERKNQPSYEIAGHETLAETPELRMVMLSLSAGLSRHCGYRHNEHEMTAPESRLPQHLIERASKRGRELAWSLDDIPEVIEAARDANLVSVGGQLQFRFQDGTTCECYWVEV